MESSDSQPLHRLNDDEMGRLVLIALDEFGTGLTRTRFNEVMLALFEHIAGLETLSRKRSVRYLKILWSKYRQAILANQHRH
jgi:hypothetical protein